MELHRARFQGHEINTEQLKELYATGEWIWVIKLNRDSNWSLLEDYGQSLYSYLAENPQMTDRVKPIHKKHKEALDHVLNGGKCYWINPYIGHGQRKELCEDFIERYNPELTYEIIKDKPSLNEKVQCQICGGKHHYYKCPQGTAPKPKVERITREMLDEARDCGDMKLIQDYAYELLEYLEVNQKEK